MSVKVYDTIAPASTTFPVVLAEHVNLVREDGTADSIQNLFNSKELGGGGDNSVTLTQEEYELLSDEEKFNGLYYTYDTKRIYKNGVQYCEKKAITLSSQAEYEQMKADGKIEPDVDYVIEETEQNVNAMIGYVPIGVVFPYCATTPPVNYLICDGSLYNKTAYPELYAIIGNTFGGDDSTFAVPNLIDRFVQGGTNVGEYFEAGLPNITGSISNAGAGQNDQFLTDSTQTTIKTEGALAIQGWGARNSMSNGTDYFTSPTGFKFDASNSSAVYGKSNTVQPPSVVLFYIIKCK